MDLSLLNIYVSMTLITYLSSLVTLFYLIEGLKLKTNPIFS